MNFAELSEVLQKQGEVEYNAYRLTFAAEHCRMTVFADGRVLVHGTDDEKEAKTLYYRYVGA